MTVYCNVPLLLWYFGRLSVFLKIAMADQTGPPFFKCIPQYCWNDVNGSGTIADEPLANYITPDTAIWYVGNANESRDGDIFLMDEKYRPILSSAHMETSMLRMSNDTYMRTIFPPHSIRPIGYMQVGRPVPDPDATFGNPGLNPLLAGIPDGLRSAVDPAILLPPSSQSCDPVPDKCLVSVAVRPKIRLVRLLASNFLQVCKRLLLRPQTNEHRLPFQHNKPATPSYAASGVNVRDNAIPELVYLSRLTHSVRDPSSIYVVYQSPQIFDACREMVVGMTGPPVTMSYLPNAISTLEFRSNAPPATKAMDFADLPCPPTDVAKVYKSGVPYFPILASTFGARWSPTFENGMLVDSICDIAAIIDPPVHAVRVGDISGMEDGGGGIP